METKGTDPYLGQQVAEEVEVQPAVHGQDGGYLAQAGEGKGPDVEVGVHDVEVVCPLVDLGQHLQVQVGCEVDQLLPAEALAQRLLERLQHRRRLRRLRREKGDLVPLRDQTVAQGGDHSLGPAVRTRRDGLVERSDLRDPHDVSGPSDCLPAPGAATAVAHPPGTGDPCERGTSAGRSHTAGRRRPRPASAGRSPGTAPGTRYSCEIPSRSGNDGAAWQSS